MRRILLIALFAPLTISAQSIVGGGWEAGGCCNEWLMSSAQEAQAFTPFSDILATDFSITTSYQGVPSPTYGFRGVFDWALYSDAGDSTPGTMIAQGSVVPIVISQQINPWVPSEAETQWQFSIPPTFLAGNQTVWLGLLNTDQTGSYFAGDDEFWWLASPEAGDAFPSASMSPWQQGWQSNPATDDQTGDYGNHLALTVYGVPYSPRVQSFSRVANITTTPEPSLLGLTLLGLSSIVGGVRLSSRRQR